MNTVQIRPFLCDSFSQKEVRVIVLSSFDGRMRCKFGKGRRFWFQEMFATKMNVNVDHEGLSRMDLKSTRKLFWASPSRVHPMTARLPRRDGRREASWFGTGRSCAETSVDPRTGGGDFGFRVSPRCHQPGLALAKLDRFFEKQPPGWEEAPKYVTPTQRQQLADREAAGERRAALKRAAAEKAAVGAAKERALREEQERLAADAQRKIQVDLRHAREEVLQWMPREAQPPTVHTAISRRPRRTADETNLSEKAYLMPGEAQPPVHSRRKVGFLDDRHSSKEGQHEPEGEQYDEGTTRTTRSK